MPRYIDADLILPEMESKLDMQELYLPVHFQEYIVDEIPTADVAPVRRGKWETISDSDLSKTVMCSVCNKTFYFSKRGQLNIDMMPYCPHCGAKMDLKEV